jgi:hypothetical protein
VNATWQLVGHFFVVLQRRHGLPGPALEFRIIPALGVPLEKIDGVLVSALLIRHILLVEIRTA